MKIGYVKSIQGEVPAGIQREHLIAAGVLMEHIHDGDQEQTLFTAIADFRNDDDQLAVYSGSVIGAWNFEKLNKIMGRAPQTMYVCKGDLTVKFVEGEKHSTLYAHIKDVARRNGGNGGKPDSISIKDHKRIHKLRDDGFNSREICETLGYDPVKRGTTVWRYMTKAIRENK